MDSALLLLRLTIGSTFFGHGGQKLFGWFGGKGVKKSISWFEDMGMKFAPLIVIASGFLEIASGILFAIGFLTPLASLTIAAVMLGAIIVSTGKQGYLGQDGSEYNVLIIAVCIAVLIMGPGHYSIDRLIESI